MVDPLPRDDGHLVDVRKTLIVDSNAIDDAENLLLDGILITATVLYSIALIALRQWNPAIQSLFALVG